MPVSRSYSQPTTMRPLLEAQLLEQARAVAEVARRRGDVGARGGAQQGRAILGQLGVHQRRDDRRDAVGDREQIARAAVRRMGSHALDGGRDGAAVRMAHHDHQLRAVALGRELDRADLRGRHDVAGHADHEQIAQALIEDGLGGRARIGAAQNDGER